MNRSLIFGDIEVSKKEFYSSKKAVPLNVIDINKVVVSNKIKGNNETNKYFIGCMDDISGITPLCIVLPQMSGYIKYFKNGGKNMSFKIEDVSVYIKITRFGISYIKTKGKTFSDIIKTLFSEDEIPKERVEHACIACISVDSVLKLDKKLPTSLFRIV